MTPDTETLHLYVWEDRFLYVGPGIATTLHRNHAAVWLAVSDGALHVTLSDGSVLENQVVYLPSGTEYATAKAEGGIAALFWEPESAGFHAAMGLRDASTPRGFACPQSDPAAARRLRDPATPLAAADALLAALFGVELAPAQPAAHLDPRIAQAIAQLREAPQHYDNLEALAATVHLSPSRFAHVFKAAIGVPVRRYLLWLKMRRALDVALEGHSLTTAALSAGFADSAHLSRTVRSMLGIAPEYLFRNRARLVIHR